jgi:hypothetical protein
MFEFFKKTLFEKNNSLSGKHLKKRFSQIYVKNIFGGKESRSGGGSNLVQTEVIRQEIPELVREFGIKTFLDAPCGDWYWMQKVPLGVEQYTGADIVEKLIKSNQKHFGNANTNFICMDLAKDPLPKMDMIFCRDCLVHLTYADIFDVINNFKRSNSRYLLTTTFVDRNFNVDLAGRDIWRTLNLELPPFNFPKPLKLINEKCTEGDNKFTDKCLGLWLLDDIQIN